MIDDPSKMPQDVFKVHKIGNYSFYTYLPIVSNFHVSSMTVEVIRKSRLWFRSFRQLG